MFWNVPAPQLVHEVWPLDAWNVPAAQLAQVVWPDESVNVPAVQAGHDAAPRFGLAVPGSQDWHVLAPLAAWNVPTPQLVQGCEPVALKLPGSQGCAVAGVVIALVTLRTTNAANARSGDRRAIVFPFPQSERRLRLV